MKDLPEILLDDEGYPTEELLSYIQTFEPTTDNIGGFIELLEDVWWMSQRQMHYDTETHILELHTGGWSGNEDIIEAILENRILLFYMKYVKWELGGHYYFEIKGAE